MPQIHSIFFKPCVLAQLFVVTLLTWSGLHADESRIPVAAPFDYTNQISPMDKSWMEQPITYERTIVNADLVVNLDQSQHKYLKPVIQEYALQNNLKIHVNSGTCGITNRMLLHKSIDMGAYCCPPSRADRLPNMRFHTLGVAPLALVSNPGNPVKNVSFKEAQGLFSGDIRRWSDIQDPPIGFRRPVQPVAFVHCNKRPGHWRLLIDNEELYSIRLKSVTSIPDMIAEIASNQSAVGLEVWWNAMHSQKSNAKVKTIALDGIDPSHLEKLKMGKYPLYRTYNLAIWNGNSNKHIQTNHLVDYLQTWVNKNGSSVGIVSSAELKEAGWKFKQDELIGEPG